MESWTEELVWATTEDGAHHAGVVIRPAGSPKALAVVWIHGFRSHFSEPSMIRIGRQLAGASYVVVSGNNRGHHLGDSISTAGGQARLAGALWEKVSESALDISAWIAYAEALGFPRVALVGHSYGGIKAVWYQGDRQDSRVAGVVSASGPLWFSPGRQASPELRAAAEKLVEQGRGYELLPWDLLGPTTYPLSAQTLVDSALSQPDVFGVQSADSPLAKIRCPLLAIFGTDEPSLGTASDLVTIRQNARSARRVDTAMIDGADHWYTGREADIGRVILGWLSELE
jgi:pimeloyl-ACP methyl ester carboxylesterase